jgi:hypothetical protein
MSWLFTEVFLLERNDELKNRAVFVVAMFEDPDIRRGR